MLVGHQNHPEVDAVPAVVRHIGLEVEERHTGLVEEVRHTGLEGARHIVLAAAAPHSPAVVEVLRIALEEARHTALEGAAGIAQEEEPHNLVVVGARHTGPEEEHRTDLAGARRIGLGAAVDPNLAAEEGRRTGLEGDIVGSALAVGSSPVVEVVVRILEAGLLEDISRRFIQLPSELPTSGCMVLGLRGED